MSTRGNDLGTSVHVSELVNPTLWKKRMAHGIPLGGRGDIGLLISKAGYDPSVLSAVLDEIPDDAIEWRLRAAASQLEVKIGRPLTLIRCRAQPLDSDEVLGQTFERIVPGLPFNGADAGQWFRIDLPGGIQAVHRVRGYHWGTKILEWSSESGNIDQLSIEWGAQGISHIIPTDLQAVYITGSSTYSGYEIIGRQRHPIPNFWRVDYDLAPSSLYHGAMQIEAVFCEWVYLTGGIQLFSQAGAIRSGGVSSASMSIDGISESVGTTASAIYGLFSAYENALKERLKAIDLDSLVTYKRGLRLRHLNL